MAKILLVEDDVELAEALMLWLPSQGHQAEHAANGKDAMQLLENFKYDLVLLDWMLPDITGLDISKRFRSNGGTTPIIFVTGQRGIDEKEAGLDVADDYIVKPFDTRELAARIKAIMRRPDHLLRAGLEINGVKLDSEERTLMVAGKKIQLRPKECALLEYLMRHPNRTYSSQQLLEAVWPSDREATVDTIRTWMHHLRQKLTEAGRQDFITTTLGSGYSIKDESQP